MVEAMTRPLDSWSPDPYAPRYATHCSREQNSQALRLPPPSSLINDAHLSQLAPSERERAFIHRSSSQEVYAPATSMSAHRPAPPPIPDPEGRISTFSASNRQSIDTRTRLSPTHSSTTSGRSEDPPDFSRLSQFAIDRRPSPAHLLSSQFAPTRDPPARQPLGVNIPSIRPSQDAQSQHSRLGVSSQSSSPVNQMWSPQPELRAPEQRMKIADLLSNEQSSIVSKPSKAPQKRPQRNPTAPSRTSTYRIKIRQQPVAARSCGYGERDRRVIDPPPIIQMTMEDPAASDEEIKNHVAHCYSVVHCTIWSERGDQDLSSMPEDYRTQRRLMGTVVSSPFLGNDENDEFGCFFCFPDLSCRTPGSFRLQFSFMILNPSSSPGHRTPVSALAMSEVFTVYNAKDFPGMKASTPLTKRLKEQGCLISIKKGNDKTRPREESDSPDNRDENADGDGDGDQKPIKRLRRS